MADLLRPLMSHWLLVAIATAICMVIAVIYLMIAPVRYAATAQMIVDTNRPQSSQPSGGLDNPLNAADIESQIAIIRSGSVAKAVVQSLDLTRDKDFSKPEFGLKSFVPSFVSSILSSNRTEDAEAAAERTLQLAIIKLQRSLDVRRIGISHAIDIEFRDASPTKAAQIANTVAETYRSSQIEARSQMMRNANAWLEDRLSVIRAEMLAAERAAQDFKAQSKNLNSSATLLELESNAQSQRRLYERFMEQHLETSQQLSFPSPEARIITFASPPLNKSEPKSLIVLALGALVGFACGASIAFYRDRTDRYS
ncbi:Wzz/FepE/Etk N-terminal domain-containing protein [Microvirga mediterraneensis]|uniref:Polysaccharide chain length determinant N-terminal domain-containing protein n=1 Tax=Microvirga mediterraneensis TaxID=2754695 RepID=A0A838BMV7_9HYPH|nr:Wzz/FepE/Etk N-terminal domain-containing protein [Microvirga mediterraneensis]MBA1157014.1 hypothetical protein [Microvirga mediterraneensis]